VWQARSMRAMLFALASTAMLRADDAAEMIQRVSEEAAAFARVAPEVLGRETLKQRALKAPPRFHPRIGKTTSAPSDNWQTREIISEYGFAALSSDPEGLHELRQVTTVDGKKVRDSKDAEDALARALKASDDERKIQALKQLEKYGLRGAATDFGQLILLFSSRGMERYEFTAKGPRNVNGVPLLVFSYKQIDGSETLTLVDPKEGGTRHLRLEGEIWVLAGPKIPIRITLVTSQGIGVEAVREQAAVDYAMSDYGSLLPVATLHQELRNGQMTVENRFMYSNFHKFGASSSVTFGRP